MTCPHVTAVSAPCNAILACLCGAKQAQLCLASYTVPEGVTDVHNERLDGTGCRAGQATCIKSCDSLWCSASLWMCGARHGCRMLQVRAQFPQTWGLGSMHPTPTHRRSRAELPASAQVSATSQKQQLEFNPAHMLRDTCRCTAVCSIPAEAQSYAANMVHAASQGLKKLTCRLLVSTLMHCASFFLLWYVPGAASISNMLVSHFSLRHCMQPSSHALAFCATRQSFLFRSANCCSDVHICRAAGSWVGSLETTLSRPYTSADDSEALVSSLELVCWNEAGEMPSYSLHNYQVVSIPGGDRRFPDLQEYDSALVESQRDGFSSISVT